MEDALPKEIELSITRDYYDVAQQYLSSKKAQTVGFETTVSFELYNQLLQLFGKQLKPEKMVVEKLRHNRDDGEIHRLRQSTELASQAFPELLKHVEPGMTELQVANWLNNWMLQHGAQKPSFDTIVASGYRSALPHGFATDKEINRNEMITVDFGFYVNDYTSDMTRTFSIGDPGEELRHVYNVVHEAQDRMFRAIKPGANGKAVDAAGRDYIAAQGYGDFYNHGSGHGIGLDIHETPNFGPRYESNVLQARNVMTVEPGVYLPNKGGVRIEDDLLVTPDGNERLTTATRELQILS
ncbi:Xaa-Pro dipeptidase [Secundilactobacillus odoratitofui DSM 19909 = JCM 15043]|uniref:Xaa-Pro dipeptidase n=1 Tax=Secundilactobacillus odoratitofui DSM 19909 = JCM 15043 TaxID=1423776 RepID=A0A0R1LP94_9LACO|nr:Xaa-Pro dipeptidase [Secundilactobacillus odoratitofui DSM 19909 = JCM 15043]